MIYRIAGSYNTLFLIAISIVVGIAGILTSQVQFLSTNSHMNFIPSEIQLEADVVILVAAFGVLLEHHRWLLEKIYRNEIPEAIDKFDQYVHETGVLFILIAIFMEAADLFFLALNTWGIDFAGLKYMEVGALFLANVVAMITITLFGLRLLKR